MITNSKKIFSWKSTIFLSLGVGLIAAGLSVFVQVRSQTIKGSDAEILKSVPVIPAVVGFGTSFEAPSEPVRLLISAIGVDANIQSVGVSSSGDMGIPTNFVDVAWFNEGPLPGMPGSAVIDGHLDGRKTPKAVFYNLGKLKKDDLVEVIDQKGKKLQFKVADTKIYNHDASTSDIFSGDTTKARLNLITCAGDWIKNKKLYNERVVVFTELIKTD